MVEIETEEIQQQLEEQRRLVDVDHFDITIRELVRMLADRELNRAPTYQRKFRWDEPDESRLIESILLGLPIPSIFVATNDDGTWEVIDGLQRLSTLIHFVAEPRILLDSIGKKAALRISELEKLPAFNGNTLQDLPSPIRLAFLKRAMRVTALSDKSDFGVRFDMFERLNRGGVVLTAQEVRSCVYRGEFNDLLGDLASDVEFRRLVKLQKLKQNDGTREELVLKFFAYKNDRRRFTGAVTKFLNDYMADAKDSFDIEAGRKLFRSVVSEVGRICEGPVLRSGYGNTPLNQFEAILVAAGELIDSGESIRKPRENWLDDEILVKHSTKGTNVPSSLRGRIDRAKALLSGT